MVANLLDLMKFDVYKIEYIDKVEGILSQNICLNKKKKNKRII